MVKRKDGKLTIKERKFASEKVKGKTNLEAYKNAGYSISSIPTMNVAASQINNRPQVQKAIDEALVALGASPEWAVKQLMKVAEQDGELGAKRLASKDILELHGWSKAERPSMRVEFKGNFFDKARGSVGARNTETERVIDVEPSEEIESNA